MNRVEKIVVAGQSDGLVAAIVRTLIKQGHPASRIVAATPAELDFTNQLAVRQFFEEEQPQQFYMAAARIGVLRARGGYSPDVVYDHLMVQANAIHAAFRCGVKKLLFLGSSFGPPRQASQPLAPDTLFTRLLDPPPEPYTAVRGAGIKLCESYNRQYGQSHGVDYRSVVPTLLYDPLNPLHPEHSPLVFALVRRFHEARMQRQASVGFGCSGAERLELLHVDDLARACVFVMNLPKPAHDACTGPLQNHINVGHGRDLSLAELASTVASVVGYQGEIWFEHGPATGNTRKPLDSARLRALGWSPKVSLQDGLLVAYKNHLARWA
ncbi:MAG: NAD-dependent epimerase/dehydratase family protein [Rhodoferax sp.]|nr:NAD-dependent epimerase/dehydratase family protein [Rhodoferax sp.]